MAESGTFTLPAADGCPLFVYRWLPSGSPCGIVQVAHGMSEHAGRYESLAQELNEAGFAVYAQDHRGHGRTAATPQDLGYFGTTWSAVVNDLGTVQAKAVADLPGLPVVLLGHSMGAFLAQQFAGEGSGTLRGLVLTGTNRESRWLARAGAILARLERLRLGKRGKSSLIRAATFDTFNRRVAPNRTAFDWLSRNAAEVDRYQADTHCGFPPSVQLWLEVLSALAAGLPLPDPGLPVCVLSGERDPVCGLDPGARKLTAQFRAGGNQITHHTYAGARHELFHEINRSEVIRDLLAWLETIR